MKKILFIFEILILVIFLFWHLKLGLVRYFDADEFAHLHWGYSFSIGERPYTDFFYLFPPFFLYPLSIIFKIFGRSITALINVRIFIFFIFMATCAVLFLITKKLRSTHFALLTVILFAFLPLPFDKMLEVRPDLTATMFSLLGLYLFIKGVTGNKNEQGNHKKYFFLSGLSYAVSLGIVPKTVFFLIPVFLVISYLGYLSHLSKRKNINHDYLYFLPGIALVGLVLLAVIAPFGNVPFSLYSMSRMSSEVARTLGAKFYMRPDIFFYPNDTYYGFGGWSWPIVINLIIYVSASIWAIHRFLTFNLWGDKGDNHMGEFLTVSTFWANLIAFVYIYPLKHAQYLIPVAPFVAFYFADLWETAFTKLPKSLKSFKMWSTVTLLFFLCWVGFQMNKKKELWVNKPVFDKINYFLTIIPANEAVWDLTGESIFFKNGYYFCCLPYGQYEEALYFKIPDIEKEIERRDTKYVNLGDGSRLEQIPVNHARYIRENFVPENSDKTLWVRKIN